MTTTAQTAHAGAMYNFWMRWKYRFVELVALVGLPEIESCQK
jgi:hypothetical protein